MMKQTPNCAYSTIFGLLLTSAVCLLGCKAKPLRLTPGKIDARRVSEKISPAGLHGSSILDIPDYFVWGGSVVQGDDGKYHMLFSLWESGPEKDPFSVSWVLESKIGYAVSDYPDRGFKYKKIILKGARYDNDSLAWDSQMVHNPHIKKFNGSYYLYYVGSKDPGTQPKGSTGEGIDKRNRVQQSLKIGVIVFDTFDDLLKGKFIRPKKPLLTARTRVKPLPVLNGSPTGTEAKPDNLIVVNPSVVYNGKTGRYLLYFKGNIYEPSWKGVHGVAMADRPDGPFTTLDNFVFDIKMQDDSLASCEDPYVWFSEKHQKFYAVVKDFSGRLSGYRSGLALLSSKDGLQWHLDEPSLFMKREVQLENGAVISVDRLERPQLLIDGQGVPQVLYAACAIHGLGGRNDGSSFNVQIPLKSIGKRN